MALTGYVNYYMRHTVLHCKSEFCDLNVGFSVQSCLRARWLKDLNPEAEQLFSMVAEVFVFWAKSHVRMTRTVFLKFISFSFNSCQASAT